MKYGNAIDEMSGETIACLVSIDGFLCNMPFRISEIAGSEQQFFDVLKYVFGFNRDNGKDFATSVIEARDFIAKLPKARRRDLRLNAADRIKQRVSPDYDDGDLLF